MSDEETLTNPNKRDAEALLRETMSVAPLAVMPEAGHLLPKASEAGGGLGLTEALKRADDGAKPLSNRRRERFCCELTGWGGDGLRKKNSAAYEIVYGRGGATARTQSSWLLAIPEVKARVEYLERKVAEAKRHDYLAAQQEIDELRLGIIMRAKGNAKLAPVALAAARDFEAAHGLKEAASAVTEETEIRAVSGDGLGGVREILAKVVKRTAAGG